MKRFPYDYTGKLEENKFSETRKLLSNDNKDRVIILDHAPFFPNLVVKVEGASSPLKRGVDYELVYQLTPMEQIASDDLFCGVQILSPLVAGELEFGGNTVGGDFVDPLKDILDLLVKHLNSPLDGKWEDVNGVPALMPRKRTYRDWADLLNTHFLADAIDNFAEKIEAGSLNEQESIAMLAANVQALNAAIDQFNYPGHVAAKNPHNTNNDQLNAHPKNLAVADTVMAYSKDFFALCDYVRTRGLTEAQLQEYLSEYLVGDVEGTFSFRDGVAIIESQDGSAKLDMNSGRVTLSSKGSIYMQADSDVHSSGEYYRFLSGGNELKIVSSGAGQSHQKIYFNNHEILNNRTIKSYQADPGGGVETIVFTESSTISLTGDGTAANPIRGTLIIPNATTTVPGKARIKESVGTETSAWVAHPKVAKALSDKLEDLVPNTRRLNDKEMKGSGISIGKGDAKLGNVDNTADRNKPLSDDLSAAVNKLAAAGHKHSWSELKIAHANLYDDGIALIANDVNNIPDNQAIAPKLLNIVKSELQALLPRYADTLVATDLEFASVKESAFTISGFRLTPTAPIEYMVSKNNKLVQNTFSGTVDLADIDNDFWYMVENDCEQRWGKAVIYTNGPTWPKPPAAKYISATPDFGKPNGRVGFKKRLVFKNDKITFKIGADDSFKLYIDGLMVKTAGGSSVTTFEYPVKPGRYCIAIELLDGGGKGYVGFEIWDGNELLDISDESWPCAELPHKVDATNNRFYLYGDMTTGNIIATAAPHAFGSINGQFVFIGNVSTNYTQVKPNVGSRVEFETTIDYGLFKELELHFDEKDAHGGSGQSEIVGLENVTGADVANGSTVVNIPYLLRADTAPSWISPEPIYPSGVITRHLDTLNGWADMYHFIDGHCPAQFHCVKNVDADNEYTVEGILHVNMGTTNGGEPKWLFVSEGKDDDEVLVVEPNQLIGPATFKLETFGKLTPQSAAFVAPRKTSVALPATITDVAHGTYDIFPTENEAHDEELAFLRYRYKPRTNELTLLIGYEAKYSCIDVKFDKNVAGFFNKKAVGVRTNTGGIFGGVVDAFEIPTSVLKKVTSYRALFEAYISGTDISKYAEMQNGVEVIDYARFSPSTILQSLHQATELIAQSGSSGETYATMGQPLPALFCSSHFYTYDRMPFAAESVFYAHHADSGTGAKCIGPGGGGWGTDYRESIRFRRKMTLNNNTIRVWSDDTHSVYVNGQLIGSGASGVETTHNLNYVGEYYVDIQVNNLGGPGALRASCSNGIVTDTNWRYFSREGRGRAVGYRMPWHTCQKAWEKALSIILNH